MKQNKRREVLERDEYVCQECRDPVGPQNNPHLATANIHHTTPIEDGGRDVMDNLVTLCESCHVDIHSISERGLIEVVERALQYPEFTTSKEIASMLECSSETARVRLNQLVEEGILKRRDVGSSATIYWDADYGCAH